MLTLAFHDVSRLLRVIFSSEVFVACFLLLLKALQLQRNLGFLNEFFPFGPVSDAVLPICYIIPYYITSYFPDTLLVISKYTVQ